MGNKSDKIGAVAVIGGGITGIQSSLDLAEMGFKVYLIEKTPAIGGIMAKLDKTFPTNDCSMCILSPKLVDCGRHENIEIITNSEVQAIEGEPGDLIVKVLKKPRYVDLELCTSCGDCTEACPISLPTEFDHGLSERKAIYKYYPQAIPNAFIIDKEGDGEHKGCVDCGKCVKVCKAGAINHDEKPENLKLNVGAVIIATGAQPFDPIIKPEFGYKKYDNVLTSLEFERILSPSGPFKGKIVRPSDQKKPKKIAWVQCVGSRDKSIGNEYCSAMCCMYTAKEAIIAKEHDSNIHPTIFYIDVRSFGKDFDKYIHQAKKEHKIRYVRSRLSEIFEDKKTKNLIVRYEDESGDLKEEIFDMVVLSIGLCTTNARKTFLDKMDLKRNEFDFVEVNPQSPVTVSRPGVFIAGSFIEPKDIPESVMQASAAASKVAELLRHSRGTLVKERKFPAEKNVSEQKPRTGVFVCDCGINIGGYIDVPNVVKFAQSLDNVVFAEEYIYTCSQDTQKKIAETIKKYNLNRLVVAACTPRTHEPVFKRILKEAGLNPHLFEMVNIREQCSWVHMTDKTKATEKAKTLIAMSVAKARLLNPLSDMEVDVTQKALVIGGGVSGMTAALSIADQGYKVFIVEKESSLGGKLRYISYSLEHPDIKKYLADTKEKVLNHKLITTFTDSKLKIIEGFVGNFKTIIETPKGEKEINHGVTIVTVGTQEYVPKSYHYGKDSRVITQRELEKKLGLAKPEEIQNGETYVMIQCVESRDNDRPFCSRTCCIQALKNAIKLKDINPRAEVFIIYRDMMTYGFKERFYKEAREKGIMFLQYDENRKPEVLIDNNMIVKFYEPLMQELLEIPTDYLILSTGLKPSLDNEKIAKMLKVPLNSDGFFLEAHVKLRPVDFSTEGIFVAGTCHSPKFISESISQAFAAASRAGVLLSKDKYKIEANVSLILEDLCRGCGTCVELCPYNAIELKEIDNLGHKMTVATVNSALCKGCGTCSAACLNGAISHLGFTDGQVLAMIDVYSNKGG
ncbi:MAG: CoB--CoM heterodisulfide reductase iron-sulfur subunit A family protein [Thermoplasmatales archaeon]|nr:MAG: CoB--CoM heterodisulfide reductase iron-sulfur subunit A family protein [Thermoplasmatales archaeon]